MVATELSLIPTLASSPHSQVRLIAAELKHVINHSRSMPRDGLLDGPGSLHDNDHVDFHQVSILPAAEFTSEIAFLRPSSWLDDPTTEKNPLTIHFDNQFRLLCGDMVAEIRERCRLL